jgi:hypothetical protein
MRWNSKRNANLARAMPINDDGSASLKGFGPSHTRISRSPNLARNNSRLFRPLATHFFANACVRSAAPNEPL